MVLSKIRLRPLPNRFGFGGGYSAKQVNDASWSSFFHMIRYKAADAGKELVEVNPSGTSQICSRCGEIVKKDLSVRVHRCHNCNLEICRDWNAALNILAAGLAVKDLTKAVRL